MVANNGEETDPSDDELSDYEEYQFKVEENFRRIRSYHGPKETIQCFLFYLEKNLLVIADQGCLVHVIDYSTRKVLKVLEDHSDWVNHLIKWDEDSFLSCADDRKILEFSLSELTFKRCVCGDEPGSSVPCSLLKVGDLFLSMYEDSFNTGEEEIHLVRYSNGEVISKIIFNYSIENGFVLSETDKTCFYILTHDQFSLIKLASFESNELRIKKEWASAQDLQEKERLCDVGIFLKQDTGEEILVCGTELGRIFLFGTLKSQSQPIKIIDCTKQIQKQPIPLTLDFFSSKIFHYRNSVLGIFANYNGVVIVVDLMREFDEIVFLKKIQYWAINQIEIVTVHDEFLVAGGDERVELFGLTLKGFGDVDIDIKERIDYLKQEYIQNCFEEENKLVTNVHISENDLCTFKVFLLL